MLGRLKMLGPAAATAVLLALPAQAAPVIEFNTASAGAGGTITWDGTDLVGSNIPIGGLNVVGADANNGFFAVSGLVTGAGGVGVGDLDFDTAANVVTISGCISLLGIGGLGPGGECVAPVALLSGSFTDFQANAFGTNLVTSTGLDTKNMLLMDAINFPDTVPWNFFGFSFTATPLSPDGTPATVVGTQVFNVATPEPATMILLGTGLLAAFRARRRQA